MSSLNCDKDNTIWRLKNRESFLTTGCPNLDIFLKGGLVRKGITQIYGESGIGKTQLALQLCLTAQIPSKNSNDIGGVAYICTEALFPSNRLEELLKKSCVAKNYHVSNKKIFIKHVSSTEDLEDLIFGPEKLPQFLTKYKIKVLIIDSIAATYRVEYDSDNLKNRAKSLRSVGYQLQKLANAYEMAVICLNQVTAIVTSTSIEHISTKEQPSLGITWASMITNSLYMYKKCNRRYLYVAGSPYLPCKTIEYKILDSGIIAITS